LVCAALLALGASTARADGGLAFVPEDQVAITIVDNKIVGVVGAGFAAVEVDLELGEDVIAIRTQGFMGVVATDRRLLAIGSRESNFSELRYRIAEKPVGADQIHVLDRLALVELSTRLVAFSQQLNNWVELDLGPREKPIQVVADGNIATVITPRRAIAVSPRSAGFIEFGLGPKEKVERATLGDASVTLVLANRILIFRENDKSWSSLIR